MKILQICTGYDISFNGGITNYVRNISETLVENGHDITILNSQNNGSEKNFKFKIFNIEPKLRPFHLSSVIHNSDVNYIEKVVKSINPDIIHVHMMIDLPINVLDVFKKQAKLVISLHDYSYICNRIILLDRNGDLCKNSDENKKCNTCISKEETIENKIVGGGLRMILKKLKIDKIANSTGHQQRFLIGKKLFQNADAIIAVSQRVKDIYQENKFINSKFIVNHIGNYTAEDLFRQKFGKRKQMNKGQRLKFGFIGNLNFHKGADIFLKLADSCNHDFHIYGGIAPSILKKIESKSNIFYHGRYSHEQLIEILQNIDLGLVLSIWEDNAPQVVFEFLNAGIPIIGTRMGGIPDFVNSSNGVLFDNNEIEINEIIDFINSEDIFNFYNKVINNFSGTKKAKQHMDELLKIYNEVM